MDVGRERRGVRGVSVSERGAGRIKERDVLYYLLSALWGFITGIAALPFGAVPFGIAALSVTSRYSFGVIAGVLLSSAVAQGGYELLLGYFTVLLCRVVFSLSLSEDKPWRERLLCESVALRMVSAATGALTLGLYRLVREGFLYYYVIGTVITMLSSALLVLLWYSVVPRRVAESRCTNSVWRTTAICSMASLAVYATKGAVIFGISPSVFLALILTLFAVRHKGVNFGVLIAICTGIFISVTYAPLFILAAASFAVLQRVSLGLASFSTLAVGMAWGIYMTGISALSEIFPGILSASVIFLVLDRLFFEEKSKKKSATIEQTSEIAVALAEEIALMRLDDSAKRVKRLCGALASISESIEHIEAKFKNPIASQERVAGGSLSAVIGSDGAVVKRKAAKRQAAGGRAERVEASESFDVSEGGVHSQSYATELSAISDYLAVAMREAQSEYFVDVGLSEKLIAALGADDSLRACVFGENAHTVSVSADNARVLRLNMDNILHTATEITGNRFECGEIEELEDRYRLVLTWQPFLAASVAGRRRNAPAQKDFCGDSFDVIRNGGGEVFAFISDGMGSGRVAARTSELSVAFLRELLPTGAQSRDVIKMLNGFLRLRNSTSVTECAASADIASIDLCHARARFYKSGAAPAFVFRDGEIKRFAARTMPIGIMNEVDVAVCECEIIAGDVIVMLSDGVTEGREECPELCEFIRSRILTHSADQLADAIIGHTQKNGTQDDVSVIVIKIEQNELIK